MSLTFGNLLLAKLNSSHRRYWTVYRFSGNERGPIKRRTALLAMPSYLQQNPEQIKLVMQQIDTDRQQCQEVIKTNIHGLLREAAEIVELTVEENGVRYNADSIKRMKQSYVQDGSDMNLMRLAFMFYYYNNVVYKMVLGHTHRELVEQLCLATANAEYSDLNVLGDREPPCVQSLYTSMYNVQRQNIFRVANASHNRRIKVTQKERADKRSNRHKTLFIIEDAASGIEQTVRTTQTVCY